MEFLSLKGAAQARLCLHLSKCHIVGNHVYKVVTFNIYTLTIRNADREDIIIIILLLCKPRSDSYILAYNPLLSINLVLSLVRKYASFNVCGQVSTVQLVIELVRLLLKLKQD